MKNPLTKIKYSIIPTYYHHPTAIISALFEYVSVYYQLCAFLLVNKFNMFKYLPTY